MKCLLIALLLSQAVFAVTVGQKAPDFKVSQALATPSGSSGLSLKQAEYRLSDSLKTHEAAVVVFMATRCPYVNAYNDGRLNSVAQQLKKRNIAFFPINSNDTESFNDPKDGNKSVVKHAKANGYQFSVFKDPKHQIADAFKAGKTPEVYLISKQGVIGYHGRIDEDTDASTKPRKDLLIAVNEYLTAKDIDAIKVKTAPAFGCSIKRR